MVLRTGTFRDESRIGVKRGWSREEVWGEGEGQGDLLFNGYGAFTWDNEKLWKWKIVIIKQHCKCA